MKTNKFILGALTATIAIPIIKNIDSIIFSISECIKSGISIKTMKNNLEITHLNDQIQCHMIEYDENGNVMGFPDDYE